MAVVLERFGGLIFRQRFILRLLEKPTSYAGNYSLSRKRCSSSDYRKSKHSTGFNEEDDGNLSKTKEPSRVSVLLGPNERKNLCVQDTKGRIILAEHIGSPGKESAKAKGPKKLAFRIRKLCEDGDVDTAKELLYEALDEENINLTSIFNCVMYWYVKLGRFDGACELQSVMETRGVAFDEGTFSVLIQLYSSNGSLEKGIELLKTVERVENVKLRPKMYVPLIVAAGKTGDLNTAFSLYEDMKLKGVETVPCSDELYACLVRSCVQSGVERWRDQINGIFLDFMKSRDRLGQETVQAVEDWFVSQKDIKWDTKKASIDKMGRCKGCGQFLDSGQLSETEHSMLKGHLVAKLWQAISELPRRETRCFTTIGNYVDQFDSVPCQVPQSLSHYIDKTGPYHVVLDALNIGYRNMNCKNPVTRFSVDQVRSVVKYFLEQGKRVLVVGAKPLSFEECRKKPQKCVGSLVEFLQQHCGVLFVADRLLDDHYSLCAAVHCGLGTQLVSTDKFRDHLTGLEPNLKAILERWLRLSQVSMVGFKQFEKHLPVDPVVQMTCSSWHFPSVEQDQWLCVTKTQQ